MFANLPAALLVAALFLVPQDSPTAKIGFTFSAGQSVYVVAADTGSRNLAATEANLKLERLAKDQFKKEKTFKIAKTLNEADFVFFILYDPASSGVDELALAALPSDYEESGKSLDALRNASLWQDDGHYKRGRHAALAGATLGYSLLFDRPSVAKGLVKEFHKDVLADNH